MPASHRRPPRHSLRTPLVLLALACLECSAADQHSRRVATAPASTPPRAAVTPAAPPCAIPGARRTAAPRPGGAIALSPFDHQAAVADTDNHRVVMLALSRDAVIVAHSFRVANAPVQVALGSDGRVFVAERTARTVSVYDGHGGRLLCRREVPADPAGLALSPDERTVYVTSALEHTLTALDTDTFAPRFAVQTPREPRGVALSPDGRTALVAHVAGEPLSAYDVTDAGAVRRALPRVPIPADEPAFDPAFAEFSDQPMRPGSQPQPSQAWSLAVDAARGVVHVPFAVSRTGAEIPAEERLDEYGGGAVNDASEKVSFAVASFDIASNRWLAVAQPAGVGVRLPAAAAVDPATHDLHVAALGTNALATLAASTAAHVTFDASVSTLAQPCGVAITRDGTRLVFSRAEHAVEVRPLVGAARRVTVGDEPLPALLVRGRALFHSAGDARIATGGLSCAGCHPDGRDDGLVWHLAQGPRQTPTLAGRVDHPFNWNGSAESLKGNIVQTVQRLGGTGLPPEDVEALAAYVADGIAAPDRARHAPTDRERRGAELFHGEAACDGCHSPDDNFADGAAHELGGLRDDERLRRFDTPSLRYVSATAPYFHDGRYPTLRALLRDGRHRMGRAARLPAADLDALVAYLETL